MPYVAGYFGKGKRIYPGSLDSSNQKRRRLEALEDVALSAGQPELAGAIDEVGDILFGEDNQDLQVVPQAQSAALLPGSSRGRSVARRTGMARRRGRKWSFDRRVRRIMLNMVETKKHNEAHVANVFEAGDGTTVVTHIRNYVQQIGQGSEGQDIEGNEIYIRGFRWIGRFTNNETFDMYVRVWVIWSPFFADLANDWQTYGNTTTASANPTQTATDFEFNIPQYDAGTTSQQFTGAVGGADTIDTDVAKVVFTCESIVDIEIGTIFVGDSLYFPIQANQDIPLKSSDVVSVSSDRQTSGRKGSVTRAGTITIPLLTSTERKSIEEVFYEMGLIEPFFIDLWDNSHTDFEPVYGTFTSEISVTHLEEGDTIFFI